MSDFANLRTTIANRNIVISPLIEDREPCVMVKVGELKEVLAKREDHPVAYTFRQAILKQKYADDKMVGINLVDLEALVDNKTVVVEEKLEPSEDGQEMIRVRKKKLIARDKKKEIMHTNASAPKVTNADSAMLAAEDERIAAALKAQAEAEAEAAKQEAV